MFTQLPKTNIQFKSVQIFKDEDCCVSEISDLESSGLLMKEMQQSFGFDYCRDNYNESTYIVTSSENGDQKQQVSKVFDLNQKDSDLSSIGTLSQENDDKPVHDADIDPESPSTAVTEANLSKVQSANTFPSLAPISSNTQDDSTFKKPII